MMSNMEGMGWGMGLGGLLVLALLVLGIAALSCQDANEVRARRRSTSASTRAHWSFPTSSRPKRSLPRGEMPRELIPTIFRVEFLEFDMIAANNHQAE